MQKTTFGSRGNFGLGASGRVSTGGRMSTGALRVRNDGAVTRSATKSSLGPGSSAKRRSGTGKPSSLRKSNIPRFGLGPTTSRRSSTYSTGGGTYANPGIVKDTRPLSNKDYMRQNIKTLLEFLSERGYHHTLSPKKLMSGPTTKDIVSIFEFLFEVMNNTCNLNGKGVKFEDEIPKRLKLLGYPVTISKSSMFNMGSPHTWPHILGAIMWLVDLIKAALHFDVESILYAPTKGFDVDDEMQDRKALFTFFERTYDDFMSGTDTFEVHEQQLADSMKLIGQIAPGDLDQLENEVRGLSAELEILSVEPDQLAELSNKKQLLKCDLENFKTYVHEMEAHKQSLDQRLQEKEEEFQRAELGEKQQLAEIQRLQHIYDTQEFSAADVERINREKRDLARHLETLDKEKEEVDKQMWAEEMEIAKQHEETEKHVQEYNSLARQLKLIPVTAENAHGIDYEMRSQFHNQHPDFAGIDFNGTIKPALIQLKKQVSDAVHETQNRFISEEEGLDQLVDMTNEREEEIAMYTTKLRRLEAEIESVRERTSQDCKKKQDELQSMLQEIQTLRTEQQMTVEDAERDLTETKRRCEQRMAEMKQKLENYGLFMVEATRIVLTHHTDITEHFNRLQSNAENILEHTKAIEIPKLDHSVFDE
ncbi:kinetochore protein NDC80 homolog [Glandiceps talaboti]